MLRLIFAISCCLQASISQAQEEVTVDTIYLRMYGELDTSTYNYIPFISSGNLHDSVLLRMNKAICSSAMYPGLYLAESPQEYARGIEFLDGFYDRFGFTIDRYENILMITLYREYIGMKGLYPERNVLIFDTNTGRQLKEIRYALSAFFTPNGFLQFMKDIWLPGYNAKIPEAFACWQEAEGYPINEEEGFTYQSPFDMVYHGDRNHLELTTMYEYDRPTYISDCFIFHHVKVAWKKMYRYLNDFGKKVLIRDGYLGMSPAQKHHYQASHSYNGITHNCYYTGYIENFKGDSISVNTSFLTQLNLNEGAASLTGLTLNTEDYSKSPLQATFSDSILVIQEVGKGRMEIETTLEDFEFNIPFLGEYVDLAERRLKLTLYPLFYDRYFGIDYCESNHIWYEN